MGKKENAMKAVLEQLKDSIRATLKERGTYSESLEIQIDALARDYLIYQKVSDAFLQLKMVTVTENTRDGTKKKPHPLSSEMRQWSDTVRRDLAKLSLNLENITPPQSKDPFKKFVENLKDTDD